MAENIVKHYRDHGLESHLLEQSFDRLSMLGEHVSLGTQDPTWQENHPSSRVHFDRDTQLPDDVRDRLQNAQSVASDTVEKTLQYQAKIADKELVYEHWENPEAWGSTQAQLTSEMRKYHPASDGYQQLLRKQQALRKAQALHQLEPHFAEYRKTGVVNEDLKNELANLAEQNIGQPEEFLTLQKDIAVQHTLARMSEQQIDTYINGDYSQQQKDLLQGEMRRRETGTSFNKARAQDHLQKSITKELGEDPHAERLAQMIVHVTVEDMAPAYSGLDLTWAQDAAWTERQQVTQTKIDQAIVGKIDAPKLGL